MTKQQEETYSASDRGYTFSLDLSSDGAVSLQSAILNKLSEFMDNYTDDALAQYVVVLVGHGKHRAQAVKDLEAFLGDDSEAFVSWLWDHLCSNIRLYSLIPKTITKKGGDDGPMKAPEERSKDVLKSTCGNGQESSVLNKKLEKLRKASSKDVHRSARADYRHEGEYSKAHSCCQHQAQDISERTHCHHKRALSPKHMRATRRLLQSAVREAVALPCGYSKSSKRLRSVVHTDVENAERLGETNDECQYVKEGLEDGRAMQAAFVRESLSKCEGVTNFGEQHTTCVWNQVGKPTGENKEQERHGLLTDVCNGRRRDDEGSGPLDDSKQVAEVKESSRIDDSKHAQSKGNIERLSRCSVDEVVTAQTVDGSTEGLQSSKVEAMSLGTSTSAQKIFNIHVNVNTWKNSTCQVLEGVSTVGQATVSHGLSQSLQGRSEKPCNFRNRSEVKELQGNGGNREGLSDLKKKMLEVQLEMGRLRSKQLEVSVGIQKSGHTFSTGTQQLKVICNERHTQTLFVSNIHFGATRESVAGHFEQCGDLKQVIMVTDVATGQHKGCAYIEFNTKDAADKALALNGSSFYSRLLKVVQKGEANCITSDIPALARPTFTNKSLSLHARSALQKKWARGASWPLFRPPISPKPSGGTLQWRRDSASSGGTSSSMLTSRSKPVYSLQVCPGRSFSYVRCPQNLERRGEHAASQELANALANKLH